MKKNKNISAKKLSLKKIEITKLNELSQIKGGNTSAVTTMTATFTQTGNNNGNNEGTQSGLNPICTGTRQYH